MTLQRLSLPSLMGLWLMINFLKEQKVELLKVIETTGGRFVQLENGRVLDTKLQPVLCTGIKAGDYLVKLKSGLNMILTEAQVLENVGTINPEFDLNQIDTRIRGAEYFKTGDTTFAAVCCVDGNRFLGEFKGQINEIGFENDAKEIAYQAGVNKLVEYSIDEHRARYWRLSNDE